MMDKLKMESKNNVQANIEKIKALFPNAVTEVMRGGKYAARGVVSEGEPSYIIMLLAVGLPTMRPLAVAQKKNLTDRYNEKQHTDKTIFINHCQKNLFLL